jgi:hypothetical protein
VADASQAVIVGLWCVVAAGCGRVGFDTYAAADALTGDAGAGALLVQRAVDSMGSATTLSVTLPAPPASGHLLVMVGGSNINALVSISGGSPAWTRAAFSTTNPNIEIWFGIADGTPSVTIAAAGLTGMTLLVSEWSGLVTTNPLDLATATSGSASPASAGTITTSHAPDLLIFGAADYVPNTFGTPTGGPWTLLDSITSNSIQTVWYRVATTTGTYEAQVPETLHRWDAAIAAFRIAP